ncbi:MAG: hypothetical protein K0R08_1431, partial [Solimicrobium sp.]|nr:hypothetical protein [Solimicrobium sp.]
MESVNRKSYYSRSKLEFAQVEGQAPDIA